MQQNRENFDFGVVFGCVNRTVCQVKYLDPSKERELTKSLTQFFLNGQLLVNYLNIETCKARFYPKILKDKPILTAAAFKP